MKILDNVYETLLKNKNKDGITFEAIYATLGLDNEDAKVKNNVYTGIHFDHRFILVGQNTWSLREFFTVAEIESFITSNMHQSDLVD